MDFATAVFGCGGEPSAPETEFHDVCFRFPNSDVLILDHISFKIKRGEKIALVGINGAGETTLIKRLRVVYPDRRLHIGGREKYRGISRRY